MRQRKLARFFIDESNRSVNLITGVGELFTRIEARNPRDVGNQ